MAECEVGREVDQENIVAAGGSLRAEERNDGAEFGGIIARVLGAVGVVAGVPEFWVEGFFGCAERDVEVAPECVETGWIFLD
jgi:hypothetical protein